MICSLRSSHIWGFNTRAEWKEWCLLLSNRYWGTRVSIVQCICVLAYYNMVRYFSILFWHTTVWWGILVYCFGILQYGEIYFSFGVLLHKRSHEGLVYLLHLQEYEDTIKSLKAQVNILSQRATILQEELDRRRPSTSRITTTPLPTLTTHSTLTKNKIATSISGWSCMN